MFSGHGTLSRPSDPLLLPLLLLTVFPVPGTAQGKGHGVEVRAISSKTLRCTPGQIVSLSFRITSHTATTEEFAETLKLPDGWQPVVPTGIIELSPGGEQVRILAVAVSRAAAEGTYEIAYAVQGRRDYGLQDGDSVTVSVPAVSKASLRVETKPDMVPAGETFQATLRYFNSGNGTEELAVSAESDKRNPARITPTRVQVAPGKAQALALTVKTDPAEPETRTLSVLVVAGPPGAPDPARTVTASVQVEVISRHPKQPDVYRRLPAELTLRETGSDGGSAFQAELHGKGALDEAGHKQVEFLFRGPDTHSGGITQREEYQATYTAPGLEVQAGDQGYGLSPLTEEARYGRGLGICLQPDPTWRYEAFYTQTRQQEPGASEVGAAVSCKVSPAVGLKANFLAKEEDAVASDPATHARVYSLEAQSVLGGGHKVSVEGGLSTRSDGGQAGAYRYEAEGPLVRRGWYSLAGAHAAADYAGVFHGADTLNASATFPVSRSTQARASYGTWVTGLDFDTGIGGAPHERLLQLGFGRQLSGGWELGFDVQWFSRRDALAATESSTSETAEVLSVHHAGPRHSVMLQARAGTREDSITGSASHPSQLSLFATYHVGDTLDVTGYGSLSSSRTKEFSHLVGSGDDVGATLAWRPTERLALDFSYMRCNADSAGLRNDSLVATLKCRLHDGSSLSLDVRRSDPWVGGRGETQHVLAYTIPLNIRTGTKLFIGGIRGRVFDATLPAKPGIAGAVVVCNQGGGAAVTDARGEFSLRGLQPGRYMLEVSRGSIGLQRVAADKMPLAVDVKVGQTTPVDLGIVPAAQITATLLVYPPKLNETGNGSGAGGASVKLGPNGAATMEGHPQSNAGAGAQAMPFPLANGLIELSRDDERRFGVTDGHGQVVFDSLRPGRYHLSVGPENVPEYYSVETPERDVVVEAGANVHLDIRVLPRSRRIRMIDEGAVPGVKGERTAMLP